MKRMLILLTGVLFMVGCAFTGMSTSSRAIDENNDFLVGYYDKLERGPEGGAKFRWLKPGVNFGQYKKVMLDSVVFYLSYDSEHKGLDGNEMKKLTDAFNLALANAFKDGYPVVSEPGPDVLRFRVAITDIKQSSPGLSAVSSIVPIGLGVSLVKKGATDSWSGSGATSAELLVVDSMTNEVVGAAKDEKSAGFTERFSKWGSAEEAFQFWAKKIREFMDKVSGA